MNELQGFLTITSLENVKNKNEATNAQLVYKSQISRLKLQWSSNADNNSNEEYDVLNALRPHPGLEELVVDGYPGCTSPSWLESNWLSRLKQISIHDCTRWKFLPPLGELKSLRELYIDKMNSLDCIGTSFYGDAGFPSLKRLGLTQLPELAYWSSVDYAFPVLLDLFISRCPMLKKLPPVFPPPVKMEVLPPIILTWHTDHRLNTCITQDVSLASLLDMLHPRHTGSMETTDLTFDGAGILNDGLRDPRPSLPSLGGPDICGCCGFQSAFMSLTEMEISGYSNETLFPDFGCFPALQNLIIKDCPELKELPENGNLATLTKVLIECCDTLVSLRNLRDLYFLSKLVVRNCTKLMALPEMVSFFSLSVMIIYNCPELVNLPEEGLPVTLNFLYLNGCHPLLEEQFYMKSGIEWEKYASLPSCFYPDKLMKDIQEIIEEIISEKDSTVSSQSSLLHLIDSASSSSEIYPYGPATHWWGGKLTWLMAPIASSPRRWGGRNGGGGGGRRVPTSRGRHRTPAAGALTASPAGAGGEQGSGRQVILGDGLRRGVRTSVLSVSVLKAVNSVEGSQKKGYS
uniref:R13L1/DRL21-like LRR repeat region domain-containing protein n=1 Tax=Leersia perrieri TaxID=77586 RepID=A0A0D9WS69_9ORYZ